MLGRIANIVKKHTTIGYLKWFTMLSPHSVIIIIIAWNK